MQRRELQEWLCGDLNAELTPTEMATFLGEDLESSSPTAARSLRFVLAVLRDIYADDALVREWLYQPRVELEGASAVDILLTERAALVESLVVDEWNAGLREGEFAVNGY